MGILIEGDCGKPCNPATPLRHPERYATSARSCYECSFRDLQKKKSRHPELDSGSVKASILTYTDTKSIPACRSLSVVEGPCKSHPPPPNISLPPIRKKKRKKIQKKCKKQLTGACECGIFILTVATHGGAKA